MMKDCARETTWSFLVHFVQALQVTHGSQIPSTEPEEENSDRNSSVMEDEVPQSTL